jgi:hypothetical protein
MVKYRRKDPCAICGKDYIIDTETHTGRCGCGQIYIHVPSEEFLDQFFERIN